MAAVAVGLLELTTNHIITETAREMDTDRQTD